MNGVVQQLKSYFSPLPVLSFIYLFICYSLKYRSRETGYFLLYDYDVYTGYNMTHTPVIT